MLLFQRHMQLTRLYGLVRHNLHEQVAAATLLARERLVVGELDSAVRQTRRADRVSGSCNHIAPGLINSSHWQ